MFNTISAATNRFLADLSSLEKRLMKSQEQVSSGLRMQTVSDDPDQVSNLLQLKARLAHNTQLKYNLGRVQTEVNSAEQAINAATSLMDVARQIATEGANGTTTSDTRTQLAGQVKDIIAEIFGLTNTTVEGRFVFSGNKDDTQPYASVDLTQANGLGSYSGSTSTRTIEHPNGSTFSISLAASQIFDGGTASTPSTSVLQALTSLYNDLLNSNVSALGADVANIQTSSSYLNGQLEQYGQVQTQVADGLTYQSKLDVQLRAQLSNTQDADATAAITDMQQASISQQAALQAQAALPKKSLFDFIG
jgi:flagellar hook-associated protein 3 FlgL